MKKFFLGTFLFFLLISSSYALTIFSDENGAVIIAKPPLKVGAMAPRVTLMTSNFKKKTIGGATGKVQIISTIESFNTPVCDLQTLKLNKAAKQLKNVEISVVTANMPFIINDFKTKHRINNINLLSTFNNPVFGKKYGVQVIGGELKGITARSIFVINKKGKIIYKEITPDIDKMPHLKKAIRAAKKAQRQK